MRYFMLCLILAMCGCSSNDAETPTTSTPMQSQMTVKQISPAMDLNLPKDETLVVTGETPVTLVQPALGWMPRWNVDGGTLMPGNDIFHATIIPTADACIVTITWYQIDTPPPPTAIN